MSKKLTRSRVGAATLSMMLGTGLMVAPLFNVDGGTSGSLANATPKGTNTSIDNPEQDNGNHGGNSNESVCNNSGNGKVNEKNPHCKTTTTVPPTSPEVPPTSPEVPPTSPEVPPSTTSSAPSTTSTTSSASSSTSSSSAATSTSEVPGGSSGLIIPLIIGSALLGSSSSSGSSQPGAAPTAAPSPAAPATSATAPADKAAPVKPAPANDAQNVAQKPAATNAPKKLANTGVEAWLVVTLGALLAIGGAALLFASRKA